LIALPQYVLVPHDVIVPIDVLVPQDMVVPSDMLWLQTCSCHRVSQEWRIVVPQVQLAVTLQDDLVDTETKFLLTVHQDST